MKLKPLSRALGGSCGACSGRLANRVAASGERAETPGMNTDRAFRAKRSIRSAAFFKGG
jgi:hypothetical protein